jgi:hypothetical protein
MGTAIGDRGQGAAQPAEVDVLGADVVVRGHAQPFQRGDGLVGRGARQARHLGAGGPGATVDQVHDLTAGHPLDGGVRIVDEGAGPVPDPVVAARLASGAVHPLLDHHPGAVVRHHEAVDVELEPVLHGRAVDLGDEAAGPNQRRAVEAQSIGHRRELAGRAA